MSDQSEIELQRDYYRARADRYDAEHTLAEREHDINARWFSLFIHATGATSLLDVGTGTGRMLRLFKQEHPQLRLVGVEPVEALRAIAYQHGFGRDEVVEGDACALPYADASFDFVSESAVLHHVPTPQRAIAEMLRVARIGIFISDSNRFGQGPAWGRPLKYILAKMGVWPAVNYVKTKGRGYQESEEDGISYSFSVYDHTDFIRSHTATMHVFNPDGRGANPLFDAATVGLAALKAPFRL